MPLTVSTERSVPAMARIFIQPVTVRASMAPFQVRGKRTAICIQLPFVVDFASAETGCSTVSASAVAAMRSASTSVFPPDTMTWISSISSVQISRVALVRRSTSFVTGSAWKNSLRFITIPPFAGEYDNTFLL